jgi:ElaB/YqjD/DUF883 family membrane-anchored ribosome-binding protein
MPTPTLASATRLEQSARALRDEAKKRFTNDEQHVPGRADAALRKFGDSVAEIDQMIEHARRAAAFATSYIREKPFRALSMALAAGVIAGLLKRR